ncbi:hypothetical protein Bca52824_070335 [Brassica carinata]|uniref:Pachytene checkpoint protein 2 homolog n=1 Tax=Brassica carinata TaxID=52824 RepID=A0A8X7U4Z4_BRACI|nr:hypothetical protein Bca52824_070335 [Brassica carinata]
MGDEVESLAAARKAALSGSEPSDSIRGLSGRSLRKLPFLAHAALADPHSHDPRKFLCTMMETAERERSERPD